MALRVGHDVRIRPDSGLSGEPGSSALRGETENPTVVQVCRLMLAGLRLDPSARVGLNPTA